MNITGFKGIVASLNDRLTSKGAAAAETGAAGKAGSLGADALKIRSRQAVGIPRSDLGGYDYSDFRGLIDRHIKATNVKPGGGLYTFLNQSRYQGSELVSVAKIKGHEGLFRVEAKSQLSNSNHDWGSWSGYQGFFKPKSKEVNFAGILDLKNQQVISLHKF